MTAFWTGSSKTCYSDVLFNQDTYQLGLRVQLNVVQGSSELQLQCACVCLSTLGMPVHAGKLSRILSLPFALQNTLGKAVPSQHSQAVRITTVIGEGSVQKEPLAQIDMLSFGIRIQTWRFFGI